MYINTFLYNILFVLVPSSPLGVKHLVVYYLLLRIQHQKHEKHTISSCINNTRNTISLGGSQIKKKKKRHGSIPAIPCCLQINIYCGL